MNNRIKQVIGITSLLAAVVIAGRWYWSGRESARIVSLDAPPTEIVKFTASKAFANLPLDERLKYLEVWGKLPQDEKARTISGLMNDGLTLQMSTMQSTEVMRLLQAREYFKLKSPVDKQSFLDQQIDAEAQMMKAGLAMMKQAESQAGRQIKQKSAGDPLVRKFIIENSVPSNRMEISAFVNELQRRKRERGMT